MFDKTKPNFIVSIQGGAGKNVMFSGVAKNIKDEYPDYNLIVISPYPELLINLPFIDRVYKAGNTPYFYEDIISNNSKNISYAVEPYSHDGYLNEREHLIVTWSKMVDVKPELQLPELQLSYREIEMFQNIFSKRFNNFVKPLLVIQPFGGSKSDQKYNWCRDIPPRQAQQIVDKLSQDFLVVQLLKDNQIKLKNCIDFTGNSLREVACLLKLSAKRILIDSFGQHCAAALRLPSTVCWITNKSKVFGYEMHTNINAQSSYNSSYIHRIDSVFQLENWEGLFNHYYPYDDDNVFDIDNIINSLLV